MASRTSTDPIEILLEMGVDLDDLSEQDYLGALMEAVATIEFQTKGKGDARSAVLRKEIIEVRKKRKATDPKFKARKTKISAGTFKKGSATGTKVAPKALPTSAIVSYQAPQTQEESEKAKAKGKKEEKPKNLLAEIADSVSNIADILKDQYNLKKNEGEFDRKKAQRDRRKLAKENLKKGFGALFKTAENIVKPVRSIFDRIFGFITNILIGKFLMKLVGWFGDPQNRKKINNIIEFLGKHWPKLLSLYLVFGTGLGRLVFRFTKLLIGGAIKLTVAVAKLLAAKKIVSGLGARRLARFLGGKPGKILAAGLTTATVVGGTYAATNALAGGGEQQTQGFSGGGLASPPKKPNGMGGRPGSFRLPPGMEMIGGGGGTNAITGQAKSRSLMSILSDPFGSKLRKKQFNDPQFYLTDEEYENREESGQVEGPGGTDKVPAMLTAGEFVMSRGAVQRFGVKQLEAMNAAGGGTNQPKVVDNKVYASVGGYIGNLIGLGKKGTPDPEKEKSSSGGAGGGFINRFILGDKSLLNRLALGDTKGALETLGIKIDNNTDAVNQNTDQRKKDSKDFQQGIKQFINDRKKDLESVVSAAPGFISDRKKDIESGMENVAEFGQGIVNSRLNPLYAMGEDFANISKKSYFGEDAIDKLTKERIASGELGEDGLGLTKTTQKNLDEHDAYIRSLYDPEKDTGFMGGLKKMNQAIQNKGAILDPLAALGLKEEGTEKFIEKITGGRVKNFGAKLTGLQMAAKGLAGPLGRMFQIDDRGSLGRYLRPAMEEAQRQGHTSVGREALGGETYDRLVNDKLANLALGQVHFEVDKDGRAKTSDVFDASAMTPKQYLEKSRKALGDAGNMLMGKEVLDAKGNVVEGGPVGIAKALYQSAFMGLSGRLATAQNTGFGNLRPMGLDIDLGGGFTPKKTPESEEKKQSTMNMIMGGKDAYYSSTTGKYYKNYTEALKDPKVAAAAQVEKTKKRLTFSPNQNINSASPEPPPNPAVTVIKVPSKKHQGGKRAAPRGGSRTPDINAGNGSNSKRKILGIF